MEYGFVDFLKLLGSLGVFLYGMKLMSEALQKVAGEKMRSILAAMTSNRVKGIFTGIVITGVIQSSSATTVMVVSFVNAGLLSLTESVGVIMGANVGTTITAWLISILGFKVKMTALALPIIGIGFPLLFSKNTKRKSWGEFVIGFSLLFIGLGYLKASVPDIKNNPQILEFLGEYINMGYGSLILFMVIGTILTVVIQSSSATMALTLVLCAQGLIPFEMAAAMVLGENIGTTITANLAAMVANTSAKRAARAHFIFNTFGVIWILILFYPAINLINSIVVSMGEVSPLAEAASIPIALSFFHTGFNVLNVVVLAWFAPFIVKVVKKLVPEKENDEEFRLQHIRIGTLSTAEISLIQARSEIGVFGQRASGMFNFVKKMSEATNTKEIEKWHTKISKYEDICDRMEEEIALFLTKVSESKLSTLGSNRVRAMLELIDDIESIADSCYNLGRVYMQKSKNKIEFTPEIDTNLKEMFKLVDRAMIEMNKNLSNEYSEINSSEAQQIEKEINTLRNKLRDGHMESVKEGRYKFKVGVMYSEIYSVCEKLGDHVVNVTQSINSAKS